MQDIERELECLGIRCRMQFVDHDEYGLVDGMGGCRWMVLSVEQCMAALIFNTLVLPLQNPFPIS